MISIFRKVLDRLIKVIKMNKNKLYLVYIGIKNLSINLLINNNYCMYTIISFIVLLLYTYNNYYLTCFEFNDNFTISEIFIITIKEIVKCIVFYITLLRLVLLVIVVIWYLVGYLDINDISDISCS